MPQAGALPAAGGGGRFQSRWSVYVVLSTALAGGVVVKSLAQRPNFYSAAVYLSQSSANLMVLANLVFVAACTALLFLQRTLYGPLRPIEIEQLYEKAWFAVTETCLAMTIFRGEIGAWFLVMFFSLLAGKVWGWIGEGRVEVLEQQPPRNPGLFHTRLALSLGLSVIFNLSMLEYVIGQVLHMARPDMMVMFGFEFAVLTITSLATATRYALNLIEIGIVRGQKLKRVEAIRKERVDAAVRHAQTAQGPAADATTATTTTTTTTTEATARAAAEAAAQPIDEENVEVEGWEGKGRWTFYLDLATDFFKLAVYISFFFILLIFYGLPLHIMRDVFLTFRSFLKRIADFMRYRTATRDMNERYSDATDAEIGREDVCIICREEMRPYVAPAQGQARDPLAERMRPKKLPCGHVLHFACLRSWLERQQICPTCRATVVPASQSTTVVPGAAAAVAGRGRQPGANQNVRADRPRVYQFGPLRIGVGAGRGDNMIEDLQAQLDGLPGAGAGAAPADPAADGAAPNNRRQQQQQYGIGIRWDAIRGRRNANTTGQSRQSRGNAQEQLEAAERQIQRELDQLQISMGELQALQNIQAQLAGLRRTRQAHQDQQQQSNLQGNVQQSNSSIPPPGGRGAALMNNGVTSLLSNPNARILEAGSDQLPEGMVLPDGWSMMPLYPVPPTPMLLQAPIGGGRPGMMPGMPAAMPAAMPMGVGVPQMSNVQTTVFQGYIPAGNMPNLQNLQNLPNLQNMPNIPQMHPQQPAPPQRNVDSRPPEALLQSTHLASGTTDQPSTTSSQNSNTTNSNTPVTQPQSSTQNVPTATSSTSEDEDRPVESSQRRTPNIPSTQRSTQTPNSEPGANRVAKDIGSSWGFSSIENGDGSDSEKEEDDEEEEEEEEDKKQGKSVSSSSQPSGKASQISRNEKAKQPKVEDEDDDEEEEDEEDSE